MADSTPHPDSNGDNGVGPGRGSTTGTPRWVKVFGIIALVVVLLLILLLIFGGGQHGPRRHIPSGDPAGHTPPIEQGGH